MLTQVRDRTQAAQVFHALGDDTRLRIVEQLARGEQCVCDLTGILDVAQSRLSFHLKTLKDAGLLLDRRDGRWIYYSLNLAALRDVGAAVTALTERTSGLALAPRRCD